MDLSVVIPTFNNSARLRLTLEALAALDVPDGLAWEVVLVNNTPRRGTRTEKGTGYLDVKVPGPFFGRGRWLGRSPGQPDRTDAVAASFAGRLPLVYLHDPRPGNSWAKNTGLKAAAGRLIVSTDDDVTPCRDWLAAYWASFQARPKGFFFAGPVESDFEAARPDEDLLALAPPSVRGLDFGPSPRILEPGEHRVGANWACPAEAMRAAGGYDTRLGLDYAAGVLRPGEETDLMERLMAAGLSVWYVPEARVKHFVPAAKCTLAHIAVRAEAGARYDAARRPRPHRAGRETRGVPRYLYRSALAAWWAWLRARAAGRNGYREYVTYRRVRGTIKGLRDAREAISRREAISHQRSAFSRTDQEADR